MAMEEVWTESENRVYALRNGKNCFIISICRSPELWIEDEDTAELKDLVRRVIGQLRPREQILFTLRFLYHMTPEEIARREECSRRSVDSRLTRLRKKLVKVFRDHGVEVGGYE